jgi:hypothetical protein
MAGFLSTSGPDPTLTKLQGAQTAGIQQAGQAYSNYRQFSRDNYANQLSNRASLYQGLMNRMAAAGDSSYSPNLSQMGNNPMSLAQTTVGATHGSNAAGNGVDFFGTGQDSNGNVNQNAYGLIGQMGLEGQGKWANSNDNNGNSGVTQTMDANGTPIPPGGKAANINTNYPGGAGPQQAPQAPPASGGFSFAPRKP